MKKTNIFPIFYPIAPAKYDKTTPEFREAYGKKGVYIIFRMQPGGIMPIYVGSSWSNVGKACIRHFYKYNDIRNKDEAGNYYNKDGQYRVSFHKEKRQTKFFVKFYFFTDSTSAETILKKEEDLIKALGPKYNINFKTGKPDPEEKAQTIEDAEEAAQQYAQYLKAAQENPEEEAPF